MAFDALQMAKARGYDLVLIDTAGRLHTQVNLMEELQEGEASHCKSLTPKRLTKP